MRGPGLRPLRDVSGLDPDSDGDSLMDGLEAIDEELEALREGTDVEGILAKAHQDLPDHSQGFDVVDAMLENLGEAVSIPTVEPVGVDIPKLELPEIQAVAEPVLADPAEREIPDTAVHPSVPPVEAEPNLSAVEMAREADAGVDDILDGTPSESGLDADDLFGDLGSDSPATEDVVDISDALAQVRAMTSEMPPDASGSESAAPVADFSADDAEAPSMEATAAEEPIAEPEPAPRPRTEPPPPPPAEAGARDSVEELDLDELMIEDDFELMIDEDDGDTFVGDADAVENALAGEQAPAPAGPPPPPGADGGEEGEGGGEGDDDPREQSFFKKLFG